MYSENNSSLPTRLFFMVICGLVFYGPWQMEAQTSRNKPLNYDTNYFKSYTNELTTRLYASVKYANFSVVDQSLNKSLNYRVNDKIMLGFGANYSVFGLNIAFNFPFNKWDHNKYGETTYLDLQSHLYLRRYIVDFYLQRYQGFYLDDPISVIEGWPEQDTFPKRPDITIVDAGLTVQYIVNSKKFSYRAAYLQNEWQKKSAGSIIFGASAFYILVRGDSSIIPSNVSPVLFAQGNKFDKMNQLSVGINAGYTYTFVAWKSFFLAFGLTAGPAFGNITVHETGVKLSNKHEFTLNINALGRASLGYNSKKIYVGVFYLNQVIGNKMPQENVWNFVNTGNFRFNLVYRFKLNKPIKWLNPDYWKFIQKKNHATD
ncbi:MAG: DUF4421 domain-containing protein [Bacteroidales bacterium]|nr:DUF4421 domain-containing protein [Bacteroidales bacterium]